MFIISMLVMTGCANNYTGDPTTSTQSSGELKEFNTAIRGYEYSPSSIRVNFGDTVRVNIKNNDNVGHGISLPAFGVREFVQPGQTKTIQFTADQRGAPETFCSTDHGEKLLIDVV